MSVITVNWNRLQDTLECLDSLFSQEDVSLDIVVVDNGSTDDASQFLLEKYPKVKVIRSEKNLGFAGGFNMGIRYAMAKGADHLLIVNNDTLLDPTMCTNLLQVMEGEDVAITAPLIFYAQEPTRIWSAGGNIHPVLLEPMDSHSRIGQISLAPIRRTFLSGCCMMVKREVFETVGYFDERFFLYYEDLDFCLRILEHKLSMMLVPAARLWHKVSLSSGGEISPSERYFMAYSSCVYFSKHMTPGKMSVIIPYRIGSAILWTFRLAARGSWNSLAAYWRGIWRGVLGKPY